jgi:putative ABC transport system permease protein
MGVIEAIRMAAEALRSNKLRSALTLLGMVIGIFAIIASVTAVKVIDVYFQERLSFLGSSTFTISRYPSIQMGPSRFRWRPPITYEQVERLKRSIQYPADISILEDFDYGMRVEYEDRETEPDVILLGTDENFLENYSYEIDQGRFFTEQDVRYARPVMVLGSSIAEELFLTENPIGKTVRVRGRRYQVVGVLVAKGNFLGVNVDNRVFSPATRLFAVYGQPQRSIEAVSVRTRSLAEMPGATDEVISRLRIIRKVKPGEENNFVIETNDTFKDFFEQFTGTLTMAGAMIGLIALLAAGIGIMNIMLVSVTERTREIGVRKAVGAKSGAVLRQFLFEALFLCQIGGAIGILLGIAVGNATAWYFGISATIPWGWSLAGVAAVSGIALVFGVYPAAKAARLDPIEALRHE